MSTGETMNPNGSRRYSHSDEEIEEFYETIEQTISEYPKKDYLIVQGDWNAKVGKNTTWNGSVGRFGTGIINDRGQRLLEFAERHNSQLENIHHSLAEGSSKLTKAFGERLSNANAALRRAGSVDVTSSEPRGRRSSITGKYPPPKPPPPRLSRRLTVSSMNTSVGSASGAGAPYVTASPEVNRRRLIQVEDSEGINFDEPLEINDEITSATDHVMIGTTLASEVSKSVPPPLPPPPPTSSQTYQHQQQPVKMKRQQSLNPFLDDYEAPRDVEQQPEAPVYPDDVDQSLYIADGVTEAALRPSQLTSLVPGLPRVPSSRGRLQDLQRVGGSADLLDADEDEPVADNDGWPALKPLEVVAPATKPRKKTLDSDSGSDVTEGCDDTDASDGLDFDEEDMTAELGAISVAGMVTGDGSAAQSPSGSDVTVKEFVHQFVDNIFCLQSNISQEDKSQFNTLITTSYGRLAFTRYVNSKKCIEKNLEEEVFYRLVQYFVMTLLECHREDDFRSAKIIMDMCFTYSIRVGVPPKKQFLYEPLKEQAIWQSTRFWNEAFFGAIHCERSRRQHDLNLEADNSKLEEKYLQNLTFGQLGTFMCNMRSFGLDKEFCLDFLRKQSQLYNLRSDQIDLIKGNIERYSNT